MGSPMPAFKTVVLIETAIAVLFVTYTYARFMMVISGGKNRIFSGKPETFRNSEDVFRNVSLHSLIHIL